MVRYCMFRNIHDKTLGGPTFPVTSWGSEAELELRTKLSFLNIWGLLNTFALDIVWGWLTASEES